LFEVPLWPEQLAYGNDEVTHILFTPLSNLAVIHQRKLEFETERIISCDRFVTYGWWKQDAVIIDPNSVVLIKNVNLCGGTAYTGCVNSGTNSTYTDLPNPC
jgi:hypothetical protein